MANRGNQKEKLLALIAILQAETDQDVGLTMPQIIERLEERGIAAERKALYRDFKALEQAGFDVRKLSTRPVQYTMLRSELTFDDVMMLIDVVQSSPFLTERKSRDLIRGLEALVSDRERKRLARRVHVRGRIRNQNESVFHNVDAIHDAIKLRRKIEFLYFSYGTDLKRKARHDGKLYRVTPVKVIYSDGNYYLAAYDDDDERVKTYRVDRMEIAQLSEESATRNAAIANYDLEGDFAFQRFSMFHGEATTVTLRVKAPLIDTIVDRFGRDVEVVESAPDFADVRVSVQKSPQFFGWVAGLDGNVTIRAPKRLAHEYHNWLISLISQS